MNQSAGTGAVRSSTSSLSLAESIEQLLQQQQQQQQQQEEVAAHARWLARIRNNATPPVVYRSIVAPSNNIQNSTWIALKTGMVIWWHSDFAPEQIHSLRERINSRGQTVHGAYLEPPPTGTVGYRVGPYDSNRQQGSQQILGLLLHARQDIYVNGIPERAGEVVVLRGEKVLCIREDQTLEGISSPRDLDAFYRNARDRL